MDPMERLIAADPVPDAERLTDADQAEADALLARIVAEQPKRERRVRRGWVPAATAAAIALALIVIDVVDEDAPGPSVVDRAVAAVSDPNAIYHTIELLRLRGVPDVPRRFSVGYKESWYGPNHTTHAKSYLFRHGHRGRLLAEEVDRLRFKRNGRLRGTGAMYDPRRNVVTHVRVGRMSTSRIPWFDPNGDPGAGMRNLQSEGRLRLAGSERLHGRKVYRLSSSPFRFAQADNRIDYWVDARTYYPVFVRWTSLTPHQRVMSETRYLSYERLPFDAAHRHLLEMGPHPGAKVIPLPQP